MKTTIIALLFLAATCPLFGQTRAPNDANKINLLKFEAAKRKLNWRIACIPGEDKSPDHYTGWAWLKGTVSYGDGGTYYEDGVRDWWSADDKTIGSAAYDLYKAIQGPPNQIAKHRPKPSTKKDSGCNYNIVLDNDHPDLKPCKESK